MFICKKLFKRKVNYKKLNNDSAFETDEWRVLVEYKENEWQHPHEFISDSCHSNHGFDEYYEPKIKYDSSDFAPNFSIDTSELLDLGLTGTSISKKDDHLIRFSYNHSTSPEECRELSSVPCQKTQLQIGNSESVLNHHVDSILKPGIGYTEWMDPKGQRETPELTFSSSAVDTDHPNYVSGEVIKPNGQEHGNGNSHTSSVVTPESYDVCSVEWQEPKSPHNPSDTDSDTKITTSAHSKVGYVYLDVTDMGLEIQFGNEPTYNAWEDVLLMDPEENLLRSWSIQFPIFRDEKEGRCYSVGSCPTIFAGDD